MSTSINSNANILAYAKVILDEDPLNAVQCKVVWVGKAGSKQEGEAGLETPPEK